MRKETIKEAETVEEAVRLAAEEWQIPAEDLQVEVLEESKKAFHLFGAAHARVKVTYEEAEAVEESEDEVLSEKAAPAAAPFDGELKEATENARAYLQMVLDGMGAEMKVVVTEQTEEGCKLDLQGESEGLVIGHRGETLDALQYLTGLVANRGEDDYYRVSLNVGGYREKREKSLSGLARKHASNAARTGRKISLEPMNPYERRIIHTAVQNIRGATSWSVGKEPNRYVVIGPSEDNDVRSRGGRGRRPYNGNRGRGNGGGQRRDTIDRSDVYMRYAGGVDTDRPMREFVSRSNPMPMADGATPPDKTVSQAEEQSDIKLYGRIDL